MSPIRDLRVPRISVREFTRSPFFAEKILCIVHYRSRYQGMREKLEFIDGNHP